MGRNNYHRKPLIGKFIDQLVYLSDGSDINTMGGLVKDDDARLLCQSFCDHRLLLIAAGQFDDVCIVINSLDVQLLDPLCRQLLDVLYPDDPAIVHVRKLRVPQKYFRQLSWSRKSLRSCGFL